MRAGYVYQTFSTFQWQNQGPGNVYLLGNVGIGTTIALAPLHVMGNVNVNGNVVFSNGTLEDVALRNVNAAVGTFGDVSTVPRLTVDAKGRVTNIVNTSISLPVSSQFTTSGTNVYIIGSNVGINTATPRTILEVNGIIDLGDTLDNCKFCLWRGGTPSITDTAYYGFGVNGNMLRYHVDGNTSRHEFFAGSSPLMTIKGDGNVGIGSTNPQFKLDVTGTIRATGDIIAFSDARLKENLVKIENAMDRIRQLTGYTYNMKDDTRTRRVGLIAQDVERVLPEAVMKDSSYLSIAYGNLAALFVEGMKELHDEIVALKSGRKIFCSGSE
jgi:hypothetical protein